MKTNFLKSLAFCLSLFLFAGCSDMMSKIGMGKQKEESKKEEQKECSKKCKKKCKEKHTSNKKLESEKTN